MYLSGSRALAPEDQGERVTLFIRERRKRVPHFLDVRVQVVFVIAAHDIASAALPLEEPG
jgi:hypothetical protein